MDNFFFIEKNDVCDMDFELKSRSLDKEQINLSEDNRSMYDIFVVSCELPVGVGVEDRKESGAWKCGNAIRCRLILDIDLQSLQKIVKSINRVFKNLSK